MPLLSKNLTEEIPFKTNNAIIHIGAPRNGTTTLQKHLFPKIVNQKIFSKAAYAGSAKHEKNTNIMQSGTPKQLLQEIEFLTQSLNNEDVARKYLSRLIMPASIHCSQDPRDSNNKEEYSPVLSKAIQSIAQNYKNFFISSERLCDTSASLECTSVHDGNIRRVFPIYSLCEFLSKNSIKACITLSLRKPIPYLRSKYLRTFLQRRMTSGMRDLSPKEYIHKQAILESNHPGTSALTPAMHAEFIKQLQQHAFVKAFGFKELLASDDVFSLMGLQGEGKYAFRNFPRENKLPFTKEQEQEIEIEITQAIKQYGFYDRIMRAQMFE